jgi:prefoldin subunit 5
MNLTVEMLEKRIKELEATRQNFINQAAQLQQNATACTGAILECQRLLDALAHEDEAPADKEDAA